MAASEAAQAVARGVKLLDTYQPKWFKKIDLKKFDLGDNMHCVLGQVHRGFTNGLQIMAEKAIKAAVKGIKLDVEFSNGDTLKQLLENVGSEVDAVHYGFDASSNASYEALTTHWVNAIERRKAAARG